MAETNKVRYGLSNIHIYPVQSETSQKITYGEAILIPGAVSMSIDPQGDANEFFADNIIYFAEYSNNGYEAELEIALIPEEFETKILGYEKDSNGAIVENVGAKPTNFALAFEFEGDKKKTRHILYYCSASRPKMEGKTVESKKDPQTDKLKLKVIPQPGTNNIKTKVLQGEKAYETFYAKPYEVTSLPG